MSGNSPQEWFYSLPPITRGYMVLALMSTIAMKLGFVDPTNLQFAWPLTWRGFEVRVRALPWSCTLPPRFAAAPAPQPPRSCAGAAWGGLSARVVLPSRRRCC